MLLAVTPVNVKVQGKGASPKRSSAAPPPPPLQPSDDGGSGGSGGSLSGGGGGGHGEAGGRPSLFAAAKKVQSTRGQRKAAMLAHDPLFQIMATLPAVGQPCLDVVAGLCCHFADLQEGGVEDPLAAAGRWIDDRYRNDWGVSTPPVNRGKLLTSTVCLLKGLLRREGLQPVAEVVVRAMLTQASRGTVRRVLSAAALGAVAERETRQTIFADGLAQPHHVTQTQYLPQVVDFFTRPGDAGPPSAASVAAAVRGLETWHDPKGSVLWPAPSHPVGLSPVQELLANCSFMLATHGQGQDAEVILPVHSYTHTMSDRVVFALWLPAGHSTGSCLATATAGGGGGPGGLSVTPASIVSMLSPSHDSSGSGRRAQGLSAASGGGGKGDRETRPGAAGAQSPRSMLGSTDLSLNHPADCWRMLEDTRGLSEAFYRRKQLDGLHLTPEASEDLAAGVPAEDRHSLGMALTGGRWGYGELCLFNESHGTTIFRHSLPAALPSGLDSLILLRYENVYAFPEDEEGEGQPGYAPLKDAVAWVPPLGQGVRPGPFRFGDLPPSGVLEYLHARPHDDVLGRAEWGWTSVPVAPKLLRDVVEMCEKVENPGRYCEATHAAALDLVADFPQCVSQIDSLCWKPMAPLRSWDGITVAHAASLALTEVCQPHLAISWMPIGDVLLEEDVLKADLGIAWLVSLLEPFQTNKLDGSATFVFGRCLPLTWTSTSILSAINSATAEAVPPDAPNAVCHVEAALARKKHYIGGQLRADATTFHFVDLSCASTKIDYSQDGEMLVLQGRPVDGVDAARHARNLFASKIPSHARPTPCDIKNALSLQCLSFGRATFFAALSGSSLVLCDGATGELCVLKRLQKRMDQQIFSVVNDTMCDVQKARCSAELIVDTTTHPGASRCYYAPCQETKQLPLANPAATAAARVGPSDPLGQSKRRSGSNDRLDGSGGPSDVVRSGSGGPGSLSMSVSMGAASFSRSRNSPPAIPSIRRSSDTTAVLAGTQSRTRSLTGSSALRARPTVIYPSATFKSADCPASAKWEVSEDGEHWTLLLPDRVCVDAKEATLKMRGWLAHQVRPYVTALTAALTQLVAAEKKERLATLPPAEAQVVCPPRVTYRGTTPQLLGDVYTRSSVVLWGSFSVATTDLSVLIQSLAEPHAGGAGAASLEDPAATAARRASRMSVARRQSTATPQRRSIAVGGGTGTGAGQPRAGKTEDVPAPDASAGSRGFRAARTAVGYPDKASIFAVEGVGCCQVSAWSRSSRRAECMFLPNATFQVVGLTVTGERQGSGDVRRAVFDLTELDPPKALEVFIRSVIPMLTHTRAPELVWQLFHIMRMVGNGEYKEALKIAAFPSSGVLLGCCIPSEDEEAPPTSIGTIIAGELVKIMSKKAGEDILDKAIFEASGGSSPHPEAIKPLSDVGANPNAIDYGGGRPLHVACAGRGVGALNVIKELLAAGADPRLPKESGDTPLHILACNPDIDFRHPFDVVAQLGQGHLVNAGDARGVTPLHRAADKGVANAVEALLRHGADPNVVAKTGVLSTASGRPPHGRSGVDGVGGPGDDDGADAVPSVAAAAGKLRAVAARGRRAAPPLATALQAASYRGHVKITNMLLDYGADPEIANRDGQTALFLATASGAFSDQEGLEGLSRLATLGTITRPDNHKITPLHYAASVGELDVVRVLLHTPGAEDSDIVNARDPSGVTPLRAAAQSFQIDVVLFLLPYSKVGLNPKDFPAHKVGNASDILIDAVLNVECEKVSLLVNCGVSTDVEWEGLPLLHLVCSTKEFSSEAGLKVVERLCSMPHVLREARGYTPLHVAVLNQHHEICKVLLRMNMDPNVGDLNGKTPAHHAAEMGLIDLLYILLWHNRLHRKISLDVNAQDKRGRTALFAAAEVGATKVVALLLRENADVLIRDDKGYTPAKVAAINHHIEVVRMLPSSEGKLVIPTEQAQRMMHAAISEGLFPEVLRLLETFSIDLNMVGADGYTLLHEAVHTPAFDTEEGATTAAKLMTPESVAKTATVRGVGPGVTALHVAAKANRCHLVRALLAEGADPNQKNGDGLSAIQVASRELAVQAVLLLKEVSSETLTARDFPLSAVHRAAEKGNVQAVAVLLDYGADPFQADCFSGTPSGRTFVHDRGPGGGTQLVGALPVHYAVPRREFSDTREGLAVFRRLAASQAAVTACTLNQRCTALHLCAYYWHDTVALAEILLENGADPLAEDCSGDTPLQCAASQGALLLVELLRARTVPLPASLALDAEHDSWVSNEVMVLASASKTRGLCQAWVDSQKASDAAAAAAAVPRSACASGSRSAIGEATSVEVAHVRWSEEKRPFLGRTGRAVIQRKGFVKVQFVRQKDAATAAASPSSGAEGNKPQSPRGVGKLKRANDMLKALRAQDDGAEESPGSTALDVKYRAANKGGAMDYQDAYEWCTLPRSCVIRLTRQNRRKIFS